MQPNVLAYTEARTGYLLIPELEYGKHYIQNCKSRHESCMTHEKECWEYRLDLRVMQVCEQLREESFPLLWRTSTFSFSGDYDFYYFMGFLSKNPVVPQKGGKKDCTLTWRIIWGASLVGFRRPVEWHRARFFCTTLPRLPAAWSDGALESG